MFATRMRPRIAIIVVSAFGIAVTFSLMVSSGMLTPSAPSGWAQVHAGMDRDAVISLVGPPQQSGWPEKIAETWERRGPICHRRLFVCYRGEGFQDGYVRDVWEGTWLRGYGWLHPRKESK